ncbi:MAG: F0F1 ATP synthase subunit epsilon [Alphaproteobacteria bacterium]|jgi:F-type H+-transporting ATPase subunit epsilon|nr:F0F1 ATP synthase subunit epsilon [Alphaproteobacteria bacterium]
MRLEVLLPTAVLVDRQVDKVVAEAADGHFGLLPRHADLATALVPGILIYVPAGGAEVLLGVDEGILVKCGERVTVSVLNAVHGDDLAMLRAAVHTRYVELDEHARTAKSALARLEAGVVRRFIEQEERR